MIDFNRLNVHLVGFSLKKDTLGGHVLKFIFKITSWRFIYKIVNSMQREMFGPVCSRLNTNFIDISRIRRTEYVSFCDASWRIFTDRTICACIHRKFVLCKCILHRSTLCSTHFISRTVKLIKNHLLLPSLLSQKRHILFHRNVSDLRINVMTNHF